MPQQAYSQDHRWVAATYVELPDDKLARQADRRGTVRLPANTKVDVLEVMCVQCRKPRDMVDGVPCEAATEKGREHLVGGTPGERKKRSHPYHDCAEVGCTLPGGAIEAVSDSQTG